MNQRKILFVAYLYPPAGGKALPGVHRVVKFIKYLDPADKFVLTLKPELYPDFFALDEAFSLPIRDEKIIRTGELNLFKALTKMKEFVLGSKKKTGADNSSNGSGDSVRPNNNNENNVTRKSTWKKTKDLISDLLTFPDYASSWILPALLKGREVIMQQKIDVVFATGMPWTSLLVGAGLKKVTGVKYIADFRDPWATNPFAQEKSQFIKKLENRAERMVVRLADCVTLNTPELTNEFKKRYSGYTSEKFVTLYNGYDPETLEIEEGQSANSDASNLVISHVGYLYGLRDPRPLLKALAIAKGKASELGIRIVFQQVGYANLGYDIEAYINELGINENVVILGHVPYPEALRYMHDSDILAIIQPQTTTQIPSKIYEYIYYRKPVVAIGSRNGALANLITTYEFGKIFSDREVEKLADYLVDKAREKREKGTLFVNYNKREAFNVRNISRHLMKIIDNLCP